MANPESKNSDNKYGVELNTSARLPEEFYEAIYEEYGRGIRRVLFREGVDLVKQGAQGSDDNKLFVFIKGSVDIIKAGRFAAEEIQARIGGKGTVLGEIRALNLEIPRTRTARASEDVLAITLFQEDLRSWNFRGKPWNRIHAFLTDLAVLRFNSFSETDRKEFGLDVRQWVFPVKKERIEPAEIEETPAPPISLRRAAAIRGKKSTLFHRMYGEELDPDIFLLKSMDYWKKHKNETPDK